MLVSPSASGNTSVARIPLERTYGKATQLDADMVAGLVLGGVLTASLGRPWRFFILAPLGVAAVVLAPWYCRRAGTSPHPGPTCWARCSRFPPTLVE
ncbi:hypothetical protein SAMN04489717_2220 [Actinopolymorpha singaporensis]|uniref:Uncharacterized protein n=1 Tax=Actinopolymorpha singaporensis TaxID=117157 RepID=A0A1H1R0D6_9ACTN|nr:hypothetical protein SAMN04489717_2220 [Actinopolymorpha singaporensis]